MKLTVGAVKSRREPLEDEVVDKAVGTVRKNEITIGDAGVEDRFDAAKNSSGTGGVFSNGDVVKDKLMTFKRMG